MDLGVTMGHYLIFRQTHACLWWSQTCLSPSRSSPKTTSGWVRLLTVALTADWIMMDYDGLWWIMAIVRGPSIIACNLDGVFSEVHVNTTDLKLNAVDNISRFSWWSSWYCASTAQYGTSQMMTISSSWCEMPGTLPVAGSSGRKKREWFACVQPWKWVYNSFANGQFSSIFHQDNFDHWRFYSTAMLYI